MSQHEQTSPVIERLLTQAGQHRPALRATRQRLGNCGLSEEQLPNDRQCDVLAALGDWDRHRLIHEHYAHGEFGHLTAIGLARGEIGQCATPLLRLFASVAPHLEGMRTVADRLRNPEAVSVAGLERFACADSAQGHWGQPARIHWRAKSVEYLWIDPDPCFGLAPALIALGSDETVGDFPISVDEGAIRFRALASDGRVYEHRLAVTVANPLAEVWS